MHLAVTEIIAEQGTDAVTMAEVATRSGVHPTSLYRRWGTRDALVLEVAAARLDAERPIPDTGTLAGDLHSFAQAVAAGIARPEGLAFLRAVLTTGQPDTAQDGSEPETAALAARAGQIQTMLDRAAARGEMALHHTAVLDGILAPLYFRHLFRVGGVDDQYIEDLVRRVLTGGT